MRNFFQAKRIPLNAEIFLVIFFSLGYFIFNAWQWVRFDEGGKGVVEYLNNDVILLAVYEITSVICIAVFLKWQGRSLKAYGFSISIGKITAGFILFTLSYIIYLILFTLLGDIVLSFNQFITSAAVSATGGINFYVDLNILLLFSFSIINPIFEEFILVGYIVTSLKKNHSLTTCILVSSVCRLSFHTYQGSIILLSILPMGIIFVIYYWYKKSITPLIIAHSIIDILSLSIIMAQNN